LAAAAIVAGKAAADDAAGQAILANTLQKTTGATSGQIKATEDWIAAQSAATGVADDELRPALGNLLRATDDVAKSQHALRVAMDVSAATGKPLEAVSAAMAKGFGGNTKALGKLVPGMDQAALASGDMTQVMNELAKKTGGAAAKGAETAAGKMKIATNSMNEAQESIGAGLLPVMAILATMLGKVGKVAQDNAGLFQVMAVAVGALAAAVLVINAVYKAYTAIAAIVKALNATTWSAGPILVVVLAVVALIVVIVLIIKHWDTIKAVAGKAWAAVKAGAMAVFNWLKANWPTLLAILFGPIGLAVLLIVRNFAKIRNAASAVRDFIVSVWDRIKSAAASAAQWIGDKFAALWGRLKSAAATAREVLLAPFNLAKEAVQRVVDAVQRLIDKLRNIHVPHISLPNPFSASATAVPGLAAAPALAGRAAVPAVTSSGGGGVVIQVFGVLDSADAARKIRAVLRSDDRARTGVRLVGDR